MNKLWCQDDTAGMSCPVFHIKCRIINGQVVVAGIAKNVFHKIEVTDQAAWSKKANFQ